jgi:hypothetical protein
MPCNESSLFGKNRKLSTSFKNLNHQSPNELARPVRTGVNSRPGASEARSVKAVGIVGITKAVKRRSV